MKKYISILLISLFLFNTLTVFSAEELNLKNYENTDFSEIEKTEEFVGTDSSFEREVSSVSPADIKPFNELPIFTNPYSQKANENESVSLSTGAMLYEKTLFKFPGNNGMDLEFKIRYNSQDAICDYMENPDYYEEKDRTFALGWEFGITKIILGETIYGVQITGIKLSDGSLYTFKVRNNENSSFEFQNYPFHLESFEKCEDEYILTYKNGFKEFFNSRYTLYKQEDRFGNTITYEYGSYSVSKIIDSAGRIINFEYIVNTIDSVSYITGINISAEDMETVYIVLGLIETELGSRMEVISIEEALYFTQFEYEPAPLYQNCFYFEESEIIGYNFLISKIITPTGGDINYEYTGYSQIRETLHYVPYAHYERCDLYKVNSRIEGNGDTTRYYYHGHSFGNVPHSIYTSDSEDETGYLFDSYERYNTVVVKESETIVYTFNNKHNLIKKQRLPASTERYTINKYGINNTVIIDDDVYYAKYTNATGTDGLLHIYIGEEHYYTPGSYLRFIKAVGTDIYLFSEVSDKTYIVQVFDTLTKSWASSPIFAAEQSFELDEIYYTNGLFYCLSSARSQILIYDINSESEFPWRVQNISASFYKCLGAAGYDVYFYGNNTVYKYNLQNNITLSETLTDLSISNGVLINGMIYLYNSDKVFEFDFENSEIIREYPHPFEVSYEDVLKKGEDNSLYYFQGADPNEDMVKVYKFVPGSDDGWEFISYRVFSYNDLMKKTDVVIKGNFAYIELDGFCYEKISLNTPDEIGFFRTDYLYNSYNQLTEEKNYVIKNDNIRSDGNEYYEYMDREDAVIQYTNILGDVTIYDYTDSEYFIPVVITEYVGTENEISTFNTLSSDKKKILETEKYYDDVTIKTEYIYDALYPGNATEIIVSHIKNNVETIVSSEEYTYDLPGNLITQKKIKNIVTNNENFQDTSPYDIVYNYAYDAMGNLISESDGNGNVTEYVYFDTYLEERYYPDGSCYITNLDTFATEHLRNDYMAIELYDGYGRISSYQDFDEEYNSYMQKIYDYSGRNLSRVTDNAGNYIEYNYSDFNRPVSIRYYSENNRLMSEDYAIYDDYSLKTTINIDGKEKTLYYDIVGRVIKEEELTDAGENFKTFEYDYAGNLIKETNALGFSTVYSYNDMNQLVSVTDANDNTVSYEYDPFGNVCRINYPDSEFETYEYDNAGRLTEYTDRSGNKELYSYDNNGNLLYKKDKNQQVTSYMYDCMNRNISTQSGNISIGYTYDINGNRIAMTDSEGTTTYTYRYDNLLTGITRPDGKSISYSYDGGKRLTSVNDYSDNHYTYSYDGLNRVTAISKNNNDIAQYEYSGVNEISKITYPEGITEYTYDVAKRLSSQLNKLADGTVFENYTYTYDKLGNQIQKKRISGSYEDIINYSYDGLNQLVYETDENKMISYFYDNNGNMSVEEHIYIVPEAYTYVKDGTEINASVDLYVKDHTYEDNRLISTDEYISILLPDGEYDSIEAETEYTYDANGNMTSRTKTRNDEITSVFYLYDRLNRLSRYVSEDGAVTSYAYNGDNRRISKTQGENTLKYYWDRDYVVNEGNGISITASNAIGPEGIFAREINNNLEFLMKNGHGDVTGIVSEGSVTNSFDYESFGKLKQGTNSNVIGYSGEYQDLCSGLIYLRNRYYDPSIGRFITEDPARDGLNWYVYCNNDPVNRIDPEGKASFREKWDALWKVGPFDATSINNIGNSTLIAAQDYALENGLTSVTDNIADAYRHFSWNYDAVKKGISVEDVMQATTNHEVLTQKYMGKDSNGIKYYKVALSSLMDLQNNKAGRYQATLDANRNKTSREVFDRLASYGGVVTSLEHVKQIWGIKDDWIYSATDGVRGEVSVLIKNGLEENALNIVVVNKNEIKFK